jgi:hypothetical protein
MRRKMSKSALDHVPHPDPGMEQRLELIRQVRRQLAACERQITLYQDAIEATHESDDNVASTARNR